MKGGQKYIKTAKIKRKIKPNTQKNTHYKTRNWLAKMGTEGRLKGLQRITLDNVLREVVPECGSIRIEGFLAQGQATERRNDGTGVQVTE